jgi:hypothetical protein
MRWPSAIGAVALSAAAIAAPAVAASARGPVLSRAQVLRVALKWAAFEGDSHPSDVLMASGPLKKAAQGPRSRIGDHSLWPRIIRRREQARRSRRDARALHLQLPAPPWQQGAKTPRDGAPYRRAHGVRDGDGAGGRGTGPAVAVGAGIATEVGGIGRRAARAIERLSSPSGHRTRDVVVIDVNGESVSYVALRLLFASG